TGGHSRHIPHGYVGGAAKHHATVGCWTASQGERLAVDEHSAGAQHNGVNASTDADSLIANTGCRLAANKDIRRAGDDGAAHMGHFATVCGTAVRVAHAGSGFAHKTSLSIVANSSFCDLRIGKLRGEFYVRGTLPVTSQVSFYQLSAVYPRSTGVTKSVRRVCAGEWCPYISGLMLIGVQVRARSRWLVITTCDSESARLLIKKTLSFTQYGHNLGYRELFQYRAPQLARHSLLPDFRHHCWAGAPTVREARWDSHQLPHLSGHLCLYRHCQFRAERTR